MRAPVSGTVLALLSFWTLGASWATPPPDPVGEHLYRTHMLAGIVPLAIIVLALIVAWLISKIHNRHENLGPEDEPHQS